MKSPVLKNIVAAVLGYVVMFAAAFVLFSLMWMVLGADGAFTPGGWEVSGAWITSSIVLGVIVAISGGFTCSKLAASRQGVHILIALVCNVCESFKRHVRTGAFRGRRPPGSVDPIVFTHAH